MQPKPPAATRDKPGVEAPTITLVAFAGFGLLCTLGGPLTQAYLSGEPLGNYFSLSTLAVNLAMLGVGLWLLFTHLAQLHKKLNSAYAFHMVLFERSPAPFFIVEGQDCIIKDANASAKELLGLAAGPLPPTRICDYFTPWPDTGAKAKMIIPEVGSLADQGFFTLNGDTQNRYFRARAMRQVVEGEEVLVLGFLDESERVLAQEALQTYQDSLWMVRDNLTDFWATYDKDYNCIRINKAGAAFVGLTPDQLTGRNLWEFFPGAQDLAFYPMYRKVLEEGVSVQFEERYEFGGFDITLSVFAFPSPEGFTAVVRNLTEERKNLYRLQQTQDNMSDGWIMFDHNFTVLRANKAIFERLQLRKDQFVGKCLWDMYPDAKSTKYWTEYHRVLQEGVTVQFEEYYEQDHLKLWARITAMPVPEGLSAFIHDITEEKLQEQKAKEAQEQLNAMLASTPDPVWYLKNDYSIPYFNNAFIALRECFAEAKIVADAPQQALPDWVPQDLKTVLKAAYDQAFTGQALELDVPLRFPDGKQAYYEVRMVPIIGEGSRVLGVGCFGRDVTQRRQTEHRLVAQNEQLRRIAWYQSHEVRGPVASILGLISLFGSTAPDDPFYNDLLAHLQIMAEKLDGAVRKVVEEATAD